MADTNKDMNKTNEQGSSKSNTESMQREQGGFDKNRQSEQGQSGQREQGGFDKDRQEKGGSDKDRQEKSAIGGGGQKSEKGQTSGQSGQFDKNRSEPTSR